MGAPLNNRPSLAQFVGMASAEIAALSPEELALLQEEAIAAQEAAKLSRDRVEAAITLRYGEAAAAARRALGKDAGTVRIEDGAVTVVADLPKRISWDQERLAAMVARIKAARPTRPNTWRPPTASPSASTPPGPRASAKTSPPPARFGLASRPSA